MLALEEAKAEYDIIWINLPDKPKWYEEKVNTHNGKVGTHVGRDIVCHR